METWKPVVGFDGAYEVSDAGNVRRIAGGKGAVLGRNRKLVERNGYMQVVLSQGNKASLHWVHRLVATAFLGGAPFPGSHVNHIDGVRRNNAIANLEWSTPSENAAHAYKIGLRKVTTAQRSRRFNEHDIRTIRTLVASGLTASAVSRLYGVSRGSIGAIVRLQTWADVT